jgi:predicted pyridoxine 5'-phosphate oxidase superfamily flavin-nucleotide-binding protein
MIHDPFHEGERKAQALAGFHLRGAPIRDAMPDQHRIFFAELPYVLMGVADMAGRPQAGVLAGGAGFMASPDARTLMIRLPDDEDDPIRALLQPGAPIGLLGIDLASRRRNRANGRIMRVTDRYVEVHVAESFGNCPQYIQARRPAAVLPPRPGPSSKAVPLAGLDADATALIEGADTVFVASGPAGHGGMDMSHRGGLPGFVRVEGDTLTIPDFRGNRYFNTFGNFLLNPQASLLFIDFETGDLLQLGGRVAIDWSSGDAGAGAERSWTLHVERGWRRREAFPLRFFAPDFAPTTLRTLADQI